MSSLFACQQGIIARIRTAIDKPMSDTSQYDTAGVTDQVIGTTVAVSELGLV